MKDKNFVSAIIYMHSNKEEIVYFLKNIYETLEKRFEKFEIICVDDAVDSDVLSKVREVSKSFHNTTVTILNMSYYQGLELSMNAGLDIAIGDFVYEFDNTKLDFSKETMYDVYEKVLEGYDIVSARPDIKEKLESHLFYTVFNLFTLYDYKMQSESFRILSRRAINRAAVINKTIPYRKAVYANCGLDSFNMKYKPVSTYKNGQKKYRRDERKYRRNLAIDSLILFSNAGYKLALAMTLLMMIVTAVTAIYACIIYCMGVPVAGWTTTIIFLAFSFFGLFAILTVVVKYLAILVELIFKKQQYLFSSIEKISQ